MLLGFGKKEDKEIHIGLGFERRLGPIHGDKYKYYILSHN